MYDRITIIVYKRRLVKPIFSATVLLFYDTTVLPLPSRDITRALVWSQQSNCLRFHNSPFMNFFALWGWSGFCGCVAFSLIDKRLEARGNGISCFSRYSRDLSVFLLLMICLIFFLVVVSFSPSSCNPCCKPKPMLHLAQTLFVFNYWTPKENAICQCKTRDKAKNAKNKKREKQ